MKKTSIGKNIAAFINLLIKNAPAALSYNKASQIVFSPKSINKVINATTLKMRPIEIGLPYKKCPNIQPVQNALTVNPGNSSPGKKMIPPNTSAIAAITAPCQRPNRIANNAIGKKPKLTRMKTV